MAGEPTILVNQNGTIDDANEAALELLRASLAELRALPAHALSGTPRDPADATALRQQWESTGRDDVVGTTTLRRVDGTRVRVSFAIHVEADGGLRVLLTPIRERVDGDDRVFTTGDVLRAWRAAERRLETVQPGTADSDRIVAEIEALRVRYQRLFERARDSG